MVNFALTIMFEKKKKTFKAWLICKSKNIIQNRRHKIIYCENSRKIYEIHMNNYIIREIHLKFAVFCDFFCWYFVNFFYIIKQNMTLKLGRKFSDRFGVFNKVVVID